MSDRDRDEPPALARALHDHDLIDRACEADLRALGFDGLTAAARRGILARHSISVRVVLAVLAEEDVARWIEAHDDATTFADAGDPAGEILAIDARRRLRTIHHRVVNDAATDDDDRYAARAVARATRWHRRRGEARRCR